MIHDYKTIAESKNFIVLDQYTQEWKVAESYQSESDLEREFIADLRNQGYEYLPSLSTPDALLANVRVQIQALNSVELSNGEWLRFVETYLDKPSDGIVEKTRKIHDDYVHDFVFDDGRIQNISLLDKKNIARNKVQVIKQFEQAGSHANRYDVTILVNGLPLVLLELKNPADEHADIWKAFDQIQTYKAQIPEVFQYNELLVIADGSEARLGSLSASAERFMQWRTIDGVTLDPLGQFNELETLVRGLLAPAILLDYLRFFVLFEDDGSLVKKVAGYHQFHAVAQALAATISASRPQGDRRVGVVWHTQGSGKSITMLWLALKLRHDETNENPTILIVTDRRDLDDQISRTFLNCGYPSPLQATSVAHLRELLSDVQHQLFNLGGELSIPGFELLKADAVLQLDQALAHHNAQLPKLQEFILPAGTRSAALAHVSRTVARRAERSVVALAAQEPINDAPRQYLNRLSDLMFVLARVLNRANLDGLGGDDVYWRSERLAAQQGEAGDDVPDGT